MFSNHSFDKGITPVRLNKLLCVSNFVTFVGEMTIDGFLLLVFEEGIRFEKIYRPAGSTLICRVFFW